MNAHQAGDARPLVARLTPAGRGAVAVVRVVGRRAAAIVGRHFEPASGKPYCVAPDRIVFGRFRATPDSECGEELIVVARSADDVEIHGHGGVAAVEAVLQALVDDGCRPVDWRELVAVEAADPIAAEATTALAQARTTHTAAILLDQQAGALRRAVDEIVARIEAGEIVAATTAVKRLLDRAAIGLRLTRPFRVTLAGRPNVGKSSLMNALVGYSRAIVFDEPGTTRDVVTAVTVMEGRLVELADTAGRREADDPLEAAGIDRARRRAADDDLTVLVCDASAPWTDADEALLASIPGALVVHNKCDLEVIDADRRPAGIPASAVSGAGLVALEAAIVRQLVPDPPEPGEAVPFTDRQIEALGAARVALQSGDLPRARSALRGI